MCKLIAISVVSSIVVGDFFALAAFAKHASFFWQGTQTMYVVSFNYERIWFTRFSFCRNYLLVMIFGMVGRSGCSINWATPKSQFFSFDIIRFYFQSHILISCRKNNFFLKFLWFSKKNYTWNEKIQHNFRLQNLVKIMKKWKYNHFLYNI